MRFYWTWRVCVWTFVCHRSARRRTCRRSSHSVSSLHNKHRVHNWTWKSSAYKNQMHSNKKTRSFSLPKSANSKQNDRLQGPSAEVWNWAWRAGEPELLAAGRGRQFSGAYSPVRRQYGSLHSAAELQVQRNACQAHLQPQLATLVSRARTFRLLPAKSLKGAFSLRYPLYYSLLDYVGSCGNGYKFPISARYAAV